MLEVVAPVFHKKLEAPLAVSVVDAPAQIAADEELQVTVGAVFTTTVTLAVFVHPWLSVPTTV
jgi:hypothetical protein